MTAARNWRRLTSLGAIAIALAATPAASGCGGEEERQANPDGGGDETSPTGRPEDSGEGSDDGGD
jgi:hypothetical protein